MEVDGVVHFLEEQKRSKELESDKKLLEVYKIKILRVYNTNVKEDIDLVLERILEEIKKCQTCKH